MIELQRKTVLVVEDERADIFPLERAFKQLGSEFFLQTVSTGQEAVQYLEGKDPYTDRTKYPLPVLVLVDLRLPGMSGLDLLAWIRQQPSLKSLPVVTLTSHGNRDLPRAYDLGTDFYLLKPADAESLADILQALDLYQHL